ncbi:ABC transporter substrate-binding protein [Streptomyces sp. PT12]|uniref:ABC transporter substrate-binding protein n=1 Tax=Streptomyces sp. PT12 TaxID=1510197 RepID=UPI0015EED501|nr:ABC transporter substrate-binding protein [Streptomyces sp. PT12]
MTRRIGRRGFLLAGGVTAAGALGVLGLRGCDLSTSPSGGGGGGTVTGNGQAPELQALVDSGELPPLSERLPQRPLVVQPVDGPGTYGETWRSALIGAGDSFRLNHGIGYENLVTWDAEWRDVVPCVAESFEMSEDATRVSFTLRAGLRWSDGTPFTVDDVEFAYRDLITDTEIVPDTPGQYLAGGQAATLERTGEHSFDIVFAGPRARYLEEMASEAGDMLTRLPKHFLERFHPRLSPDAERAAQDRGYTGPVELLQDAVYGGMLWTDPELPRLHAWLPQDAIGDGTRMRFTRNPYYWKVDPEGNQLPYLNGVDFTMAQDAEVVLLRVLGGEVDLMDRHVTTTQNKPVLAEGREDGGYGFYDLETDKVNTLSIMLNLTSQDEVKREIFGNRDFRIGLSYAIDRQRIINAVHARQGEPWQVAPSRASDFFDEEMATQFTEYDVAAAEEHLDRAGFTRRGGDGPRLGPDGEPISFRVLVGAGAAKPELLDALEILLPMWREVGVEARIQSEDLTLRTQLIQANEHDALVWDGDGGLNPMAGPGMYMPQWGENNAFCPEWFTWLETGGDEGMEPPEPAKEQYRIYTEELTSETDAEGRADGMRRILEIAKEQFWTIGISTALPGYGVVGNALRNMPERTFFAATYPYPGGVHPEQFFIER